ncbi:MAG: citrate (Si)-synthase, partial [Verrucomicrobia bacterium]|nr:citrate (Si)-synthase [Verrucomicrobiota bacterium]
MSGKAILDYDGKKVELDAVIGTENEVGLDITKLRAQTGLITLDPGFANTGSCKSDITFINGEKGILRYRGYAIEELAEKSSFLETAYLVLYGYLPSQKELNEFDAGIADEAELHTSMKSHFEGFPDQAPPMAILSSMLNTLACYNPELLTTTYEGEAFDTAVAKIMS